MPIPLAIPLITSLAGGAFGAFKSAQQNKKNDDLLKQRFGELESWYNDSYHGGYLESDEGQSILQELYRNTLEGEKRNSRRQKVTGASNEQRLTDKKAVLGNMGDVVNQLASRGTRYKDNIQRQYMNQKNGLQDMQMALNQQKSDQWTTFMNNAASAGAGLAAISGGNAVPDMRDTANNQLKGMQSQWFNDYFNDSKTNLRNWTSPRS